MTDYIGSSDGKIYSSNFAMALGIDVESERDFLSSGEGKSKGNTASDDLEGNVENSLGRMGVARMGKETERSLQPNPIPDEVNERYPGPRGSVFAPARDWQSPMSGRLQGAEKEMEYNLEFGKPDFNQGDLWEHEQLIAERPQKYVPPIRNLPNSFSNENNMSFLPELPAPKTEDQITRTFESLKKELDFKKIYGEADNTDKAAWYEHLMSPIRQFEVWREKNPGPMSEEEIVRWGAEITQIGRLARGLGFLLGPLLDKGVSVPSSLEEAAGNLKNNLMQQRTPPIDIPRTRKPYEASLEEDDRIPVPSNV